MPTRTWVDRGGTFTDVVVLHADGEVEIFKIPSDQAVVGRLAQGLLTLGTTVATNALLERAGVPTLLVAEPGLEDLVHIGDMARPSLFEPDATWPPPLCQDVVSDPNELSAALARLGPGASVAIALVDSPGEPEAELRLARQVREAGAAWVSLGHELSPEVGYLARVETALVDAAITPVLRQALDRDQVPPEALAMRSDGSLCPVAELRAPDAVLSGPAGGVLAVAEVARQAGFSRAVGLDMGGTSTDVCRVDLSQGLPRRTEESRVAGVRLRRPMLEVETIAAGGGSVLWSDGVRLGVGPRSAGADPGPQCYGRGGPPTLTDAALAQGLVDPTAFSPPLDPGLVQLPSPAADFLDLAREDMAAAVRRLAARRGVDLSDHALVAYGGAAGQHAAPVAERLGMGTVLVHPCASVLSAWGQSLARREEWSLRSLWLPLSQAWTPLQRAWAELEAELPPLGEVERSASLRHVGTDHALEVALPEGGGSDELVAAFVSAHRQRFGFDRDLPVEVVDARVRVREPEPEPVRVQADPWGLGERVVEGPTLLTAPTTSVWVPAGWTAKLADGVLKLESVKPGSDAVPTGESVKPGSDADFAGCTSTPAGVSLWSSRFQAVAEQAGETLRRLARSVNIRERLDFSCAVFDGQGQLVANAPHIPVHLGAMGLTVRDLLARVPDPQPGQAWLSNDPVAGGAHLPDLTVVTCVQAGDCRWFVASRGHHVDVGGLTPGSMPPHATTLDQEGLVLRHVPLLEDGHLRDLRPLLAASREPETVAADLEAQVAANTLAARLLAELGPAQVVDAWMAHLLDAADQSAARLLQDLRPGRATDELDSIPLEVRLDREDDHLVVDLRGCKGPHPGNLNAPPAVVRASVLYALRVLAGAHLPLSEGALRRVRILTRTPSVVSPPPGAAVAGGNVETSQRLVDLILRAARARAASQGTMNNLTLGGAGWSLYETLGGGQGASPAGPGPSGMQVHMTNTRATDPEVLSRRLPVRVVRFALRQGSGGAGEHQGGDGLIRELEVGQPATAALLAAPRPEGAPGLDGGEPGQRGHYQVRLAGRWQDWDGQPVDLEQGDRVRLESPGGGGWG